jgi:DNA-binding response OmpR family regulator
MRILVVDDDKRLCDTLKRGLEENSYAVDCAHDGEDGQLHAEMTPYDLIILDVMMPKKDGWTLCRDLRNNQISTPVLMLTAKDEVADRVCGLDSGADDYLVKPFAIPELLARVRALLRRGNEVKSTKLTVGQLHLDTVTREVSWKGRPISLTTKEYAILEYFMRQPNAVITRTMIEEHAWDYDFDSMSNLVDVYIKRLRNKIDPEEGKQIITTIRGAGYKIQAL